MYIVSRLATPSLDIYTSSRFTHPPSTEFVTFGSNTCTTITGWVRVLSPTLRIVSFEHPPASPGGWMGRSKPSKSERAARKQAREQAASAPDETQRILAFSELVLTQTLAAVEAARLHSAGAAVTTSSNPLPLSPPSTSSIARPSTPASEDSRPLAASRPAQLAPTASRNHLPDDQRATGTSSNSQVPAEQTPRPQTRPLSQRITFPPRPLADRISRPQVPLAARITFPSASIEQQGPEAVRQSRSRQHRRQSRHQPYRR